MFVMIMECLSLLFIQVRDSKVELNKVSHLSIQILFTFCFRQTILVKGIDCIVVRQLMRQPVHSLSGDNNLASFPLQ